MVLGINESTGDIYFNLADKEDIDPIVQAIANTYRIGRLTSEYKDLEMEVTSFVSSIENGGTPGKLGYDIDSDDLVETGAVRVVDDISSGVIF